MNSSSFTWMALAASLIALGACFFNWTSVAQDNLFRIAEDTGAVSSMLLQKISFGVMAAMAAYIAWSFRTNPFRKYAQLMVLFGFAMLMILLSTRPWQWSDVGLRSAAGFIVCAAAAADYLIASLIVLILAKRSVQPK